MADNDRERLARLEASVDDIKATLARLEPLIVKVVENQAEMRGEMRGQFEQMGQRISDINARLPVPIAYSPPKPAA